MAQEKSELVAILESFESSSLICHIPEKISNKFDYPHVI